jgi:hypothetical protein
VAVAVAVAVAVDTVMLLFAVPVEGKVRRAGLGQGRMGWVRQLHMDLRKGWLLQAVRCTIGMYSWDTALHTGHLLHLGR